MLFPHPVTENKRQELIRELEFQKERFVRATSESSAMLSKAVSPRSWIRNYPGTVIGSAMLMGFLTRHLVQRRADHDSSEPS